MKVLVINGPNLNNSGRRDKVQYGSLSLDEIHSMLCREFPEISFTFFQSNIEGELIDRIQQAEGSYDALIINPGGYAHTSVSIRDALADLKIVRIEVHLSNLAAREEFRQKTLTASVCNGYISGFKELSYTAAVYLIIKIAERQ